MERTAERVTVESGSKFIGKTFLYMFFALLITIVVSVGVGLLFSTLFTTSFTDDQFVGNFGAYLALLIVSAIGLLGVGIWFNVAAYRGKHSLWVPFIIYSVLMGTFGSFFTIFVSWDVLAISLGITTVAFGGMAAIGLLSKKDLNFLAIVAMGLGIGILALLLMNIFFYFVFPVLFAWNYVLIQALVLVLVLIVTIIDTWRVKKIAERGEANENLALFCAFNLYIDFIQLLIRVIYIVLIARRN